MADPVSGEPPRPTLAQLAWLFFTLGCTAFGGPAAHIAMMEDAVVTRRRWMTRERFLDLLAATNLIPGPNSTELAIHVGLLAGWRGLVVSGVCFILPAALITGLLASLYVGAGQMPEAKRILDGVLYGVKPVIIAVVVQALLKFCRDSLRSSRLAAVALMAGVLSWVAVDELLILFVAGLVVATTTRRPPAGLSPPGAASPVGPFALAGTAAGVASGASAFGLWPLFLVFVRVGSVLFGSGYVLLAFLRADLVERRGWLGEGELLDAVAVGQVTPGPVFTTATFIGYLLGARHGTGGVAGAAVATVGIFLPAFFFVAISGPLVPRIRRSPTAGAFLDGVVAGSLGLMAVVTFDLAWAALIDWLTAALALSAGAVLYRYRVNSSWLVLAGAALGWAVTSFSR